MKAVYASVKSRSLDDVEALDLLEEFDVECISFDALFQRHGVTKIDALITDAEGYDYHLLKQFDVEKLRPSLIYFEHLGMSSEDKDSACRMLTQKGYELMELDRDVLATLV